MKTLEAVHSEFELGEFLKFEEGDRGARVIWRDPVEDVHSFV
jgi:hypothetical protein